jgi:hypothetical protein
MATMFVRLTVFQCKEGEQEWWKKSLFRLSN